MFVEKGAMAGQLGLEVAQTVPVEGLRQIDIGNNNRAELFCLSDRPTREPLTASGSTDTALHTRNFLDSVKSRQPANCPIDVGHRSTTATLLANITLRVGRQICWDAVREQILNDEEACRLLSYDYRPPWKLT